MSKVVVVTGASQGIGAGLVAGFRARGDRVVATSRSIRPDHARAGPRDDAIAQDRAEVLCKAERRDCARRS